MPSIFIASLFVDAISDKSYAFVNQVIETNNYSILLEETKADEKKFLKHLNKKIKSKISIFFVLSLFL